MRNFLLFFSFFLSIITYAQSWKPTNGSTDSKNHFTAFTNATIFVKSDEVLEKATLLIKNDKIVKVGTGIEIPENAVIINLEGKFIYPSFIDLYTEYGIQHLPETNTEGKKPQHNSKKEAFFYWNETIKPETSAAELVSYNSSEAERYRKMGFGAVLTHQNDGLIRGTSALVTLSNKADFRILSPEAATYYSFEKGSSNQTYPNSLMGKIALIRQAHFDAEWYKKNEVSTEYNRSLEAINETNALPKLFDTPNTLSMLRADKIGDEFGFQFILKGNGTEYKRIEEVKNTGAVVIAPVNFPKAYDVTDPYDAVRLPLSTMKEWELASENLRFLQAKEIDFAITAKGVKNKKEFFKNLTLSVEKGVSSRKVIKALTEIPARLMGKDSVIGTLHAGKLASFIITSDSLFSKEVFIYDNWIVGKRYEVEQEQLIDFEGTYSLNINKKLQFTIQLKQKGKGYTAKVTKKNASDFKKADFSTINNRITLAFSSEGILYRLSGSSSDAQSRIWTGKAIVDGKWVDWAAIKKNDEIKESKQDSIVKPPLTLNTKVYYPNMAFGWDSLPEKGENIVFRNATVWTNEEEGILKNHDVVISDGKIKMIGYKINLEVMFPEHVNSMKEIDASGMHLTSGIIDEHSHIGIEKGVNESGQAITAEVSIGDVVDANDINIYRQLSGGVTASQLLHGSANPIGGQSALIKLRWGQTPEKMKIEGADGFIKFALGENVKQSNWGDHRKVRFPQTRMGVEQVFYDAFIRAKEYKAEWQLYNAKSKKEKKKNLAPRVDLELQALAEILDTTRFITCHSYIQSEINMLMHVGDSMGFRVNTFTHVLEGYKIADKLKEHGAAASTFSDWWAYKFEVNDAIPYNGAILQEQGVLAGFNSDDAEMGRRLNQEAAKAVKYGGVSEEEAWKFVTLNPAKMLHLDDRMGSIKVGKDADLVLWTDHPLSVYTKVQQSYIDGIAYYDAERDQELRKRLVSERERIIAKMLEVKRRGEATQKVKTKEKKLYECDTIEK